MRTERHKGDKFPGEFRPDINTIKEELRKKYNMAVDEEYKIDQATWKEFIKVEIICAGYNKGKKNYIEFTDPTCPNYNVLVYNYAEDNAKNNPFIGFE